MQIKKTLLIVDDDRNILELLNSAMVRAGYKTVLAMDGQEALELVSIYKPSLIMLDMSLPRAGGFEVIKALQNEEHSKIPVIIATGEVKDDSLWELMKKEPNVKGFFPKPIRIAELMISVEQILK